VAFSVPIIFPHYQHKDKNKKQHNQMANEQNLIPAKKGEIRNPKGRGKGVRGRATIVREWLMVEQKFKNPLTGQEEILSQADIMTLAVINKARKGDVIAFRELMDSGFGKNKEIQETMLSVTTPTIVFKNFDNDNDTDE